MTILEARIRRSLFGTRCVQIFISGVDVFGSDEDVVRLSRTSTGVRVWALWSDRCDGVETNLEVLEFWFPAIDELRVWK